MWGKSIFEVRRLTANIDPRTRAMLAFTAGELILRRGYSQIYDYATAARYKLRAHLNEFELTITDSMTGDQLSGGAFGQHFTLERHQDGARMELNLAGFNFDGEDGMSGRKFRGYVKGNMVTFIEGSRETLFGLA